MARILCAGEWFEELASTSLYETEYERILFQQAGHIFPEYYPVPFKTIVISSDGDAKPDFALIHKDYRRWWVVEVEMGHHSLEGHVIPQVRSLAEGQYGDEEANYLCDQAPMLDSVRIREMVKGQTPRILVVVNVPVAGWQENLRPFDALVVVCQIFRSRFNRHIYRLNGDYPSENNAIITTCRCWEIHRFLKIDAPTHLEIKRGERITLEYEGRVIEWERVDTADAVLLHALRGHPLTKGVIYEILKRNDGKFIIQPAKTKK